MRVTIMFTQAPGPVQIDTLILRIDTLDIVEAVSRAINHAVTLTTVPIKSVHVQVQP